MSWLRRPHGDDAPRARQKATGREDVVLLHEANESIVAALAAALELRDDETGSHAHRVTEIALAIAREVDPALASDPELRFGFLLHDIGKIGIPDRILLKPAALDEEEMRQMQTHTLLGEHLISAMPHLRGIARDVIVHHHERWDGDGYPWGLAGEAIPLAARIFAVADAFDALTSDRPYRAAVSRQEALAEIHHNSGTQFDPAIVEALARTTNPAVRELQTVT
jgi:HD-GYP domain-containing protein (c-di-GMP phosphodiesterase class II)